MPLKSKKKNANGSENKSSTIKAIVNEFYPDGLRMIEIYKHQFKNLSDIIANVKNRNYKFIIYMIIIGCY